MGQELKNVKSQTVSSTPEEGTHFERLERDIDLTYFFAAKQAIMGKVKHQYTRKQHGEETVKFPDHYYISQTLTDGPENNLKATAMLGERLTSQEVHFRNLKLPLNIDSNLISEVRHILPERIKTSFIRMKRNMILQCGNALSDEHADAVLAFFEAQIKLYIRLQESIAYIHPALHDDPQFKDILERLDALFMDYVKLSPCITQNIEDLKIFFSIRLMSIFDEIRDFDYTEIDGNLRLKKSGSLDFLLENIESIKTDHFTKGVFIVDKEPMKTIQLAFSPEELMGQFENKVKAELAKAIYPKFTPLESTTDKNTPFPKVSKRAVGGVSTAALIFITVLVLAAVFSMPILWAALGVIGALTCLGVGLYAYQYTKAAKLHKAAETTPGEGVSMQTTTDAYLTKKMLNTPPAASVTMTTAPAPETIPAPAKEAQKDIELRTMSTMEPATETTITFKK